MKLIAIEEHFLTSEVKNAWKKNADDDPTNKLHFDEIENRLEDIGNSRLQLMDETGIDVQVLSLTSPSLHNLEIGNIKSNDNGFSSSCAYYEVIETLKKLARNHGANLIKITNRKSPDQWSTCERITAKIYKVSNFRVHEKEIEWTDKRKLTWEEFKGSPKTISNSNTAAQTYCGFGFQTNNVTIFNTAKIFTTNNFTTHLSWVRPDQKYRLDLLEHEQGHFDLCEVYARQLRNTLEGKKLSAFNLHTGANVIVKKVYASYLERQELYESETQYGIDRKKQFEWMKLIASELNELSSFSK